MSTVAKLLRDMSRVDTYVSTADISVDYWMMMEKGGDWRTTAVNEFVRKSRVLSAKAGSCLQSQRRAGSEPKQLDRKQSHGRSEIW